ncbi:MAG TPA: DUF1045 domain-containing protein [Devosia sp.]|jgi:hypothetical protein|nr:DUF1045 domain-containing protein [Devosia sp.]
MTVRYAIYFAPARDALLWQLGTQWLAQPDLESLTISARRYGFHATLKAPMKLSPSSELKSLRDALCSFTEVRPPVALTGLAPHMIDGFLALTADPQPEALTALASEVVREFDDFRELLTLDERERRLKAPLSDRQIELVDLYGYPYVLDQFQFHMTLSDRLTEDLQQPLLERAEAWFAKALAETVLLDRLVVFAEPEPRAAFQRLDPDYVLRGP